MKLAEDPDRITAVRLTRKRQKARVGDVFRLSPAKGVVLWGRVVKQGAFFGVEGAFHLVHVYDSMSERMPAPSEMNSGNLLIPPQVVNNLGFSRGYWEIVANVPSSEEEAAARKQLFQKGFGLPGERIVDAEGNPVQSDRDVATLPRAAFGNFNSVDERVRIV